MHRVPTSIPPSQSATTSACGGGGLDLHSDTWPTLPPQFFGARTREIHSGTRGFGNDTNVWGVARAAWPNYQRHHLPHHPTDPIHDPIVERPHAHGGAQQLPGISKLRNPPHAHGGAQHELPGISKLRNPPHAHGGAQHELPGISKLRNPPHALCYSLCLKNSGQVLHVPAIFCTSKPFLAWDTTNPVVN